MEVTLNHFHRLIKEVGEMQSLIESLKAKEVHAVSETIGVID